MNQQRFDVLIIGAGAAGLIAALEIALTGKSVTIIEAKERCGGRIHTIYHHDQQPVELGAEFVHGDLPLTLQLFEKAGISKLKADAEIWQHKDGQLEEQEDFIEDYQDLEKKFKEVKTDIPVAEFMRQHLADEKYTALRFSLKNYVEGYYAADIEKASTHSFCKELTTGEEKNYRVEGGYQQLVTYLEEQCRSKSVRFYLEEEVREIKWSKSNVEVVTNKQTVFGKKVIVTVSIGVLQSEAVLFSPALPHKISAAKTLGYGLVAKIILRFTDAFWKDQSLTNDKNLSRLGFLFSEEAIPTWWTQYPQKNNLMVGWLAGPPAQVTAELNKEELIHKAITSLAKIFAVDASFLKQKLVSADWYNWLADKHFCGTYSYAVVDGETLMKTILHPADDTVYFAGEGLYHGNEIGTVEAALTSGRNVAHQLIAHF
jgi:monoamine oxidase